MSTDTETIERALHLLEEVTPADRFAQIQEAIEQRWGIMVADAAGSIVWLYSGGTWEHSTACEVEIDLGIGHVADYDVEPPLSAPQVYC